MVSLASRASSRAVAATPHCSLPTKCPGVGGCKFSWPRHRPRLQRCPRYLCSTGRNFRGSDAPPPLEQQSSTPTPPSSDSVVAKPHFPWTKIVISSDEKRRSSRSLPGPFAAEQPTDASYLSRVVRCAPASDEAPRGPNWQSINRRTRRPKFHDERPATPRCLLALPTEASSFP